MAQEKVIVRTAPSPTGFAHVGTGYTSLFNYAFARHNNGIFIVRLEDTDRKRHVVEAEQAIYDGLSWLGLSWDEGPDKGGPRAPYRQSERLPKYQAKIDELISRGLAYKDEGAVRFKNPGEAVSWDDLIRGHIEFAGSEITDFVILKSDGYPTYNFGVVIDDIEMGITHVIRGEEHISNTPRQLALYKAFGKKPPFFAHHPTLRGIDRKKLSKRRDPVNLKLYQEDGYLPEALLNFFMLMGWSHPEEKEIISLTEFVELFDLSRVRKAGPVFDVNKLDWINSHYIMQKSNTELAQLLVKYAPKGTDVELLNKLSPLVKERMKKLSDFTSLSLFFFEEPIINKDLFSNDYLGHLKLAAELLSNISEWTAAKMNELLMPAVKEKGYKPSNFFMDLRIAVTGQKITPPLNESMEILGQKKVLKRLENILQ